MADLKKSTIAGSWGEHALADVLDGLTEPDISTRLISEQKNSRSIFVAYPYEFSKDDYRGAFNEVAEEYEVEFTYADEQITSQQILEKVTRMIKESGFAIFDITNWNPNVALELGIATG